MSQQNKSQATVAALQAKIAEQQLHIEVLVSSMFAQKQRADKLQQELNELDKLIRPYDDGPDMPSGRVDYGLLTEPAFRARFFNRPLTPAEAEVIESEMGRIELAAETENAQSDCADAYEAWLQSEKIPGKRERLTPGKIQEILDSEPRYNEAPTLSADVIFTDEGKLCVKLESSAGQEAWYGFSTTPDGKPRLVLLPDSVDELPF